MSNNRSPSCYSYQFGSRATDFHRFLESYSCQFLFQNSMVYHIESCLKIEKNYTYITSLILFLFEIICEVYETGRICSPNNILAETLSPTNHSKYKSCARAYYIRCLVIKLTRTRICVRNGYLNKGSCFLFLVSSSILNTSHV